MYKDLKGKNALITGAGKKAGIGYAIAGKLAACGVNVALADLAKAEENDPLLTSDKAQLARLAKSLGETWKVRTVALDLDVTSPESVQNMATVLAEEFNNIHILCNNAGTVFGVPNTIHTYDDNAWMKTIDVNLHGIFRVSKAVVPLMLENGGSIINAASQAAKKPPLFNGAYAAAKAGVLMMTKVMAMELAGNGIRVNAVCPGVIMTDFTQWRFDLEAQFFNATPDERIAEKCKEIPLGRLGTADEVANTVAFLASGESSYMTGQALNITGGQTMEL
ncbi:MAG: SDR family NAD(P)-dependent oxidoreductase [Deltaproteobacteria bacterium]|nr:MAG: SDR family NAD(P)-dependent oxidoreductase [Deltaproteobacteria bacterium]RLC14997.1 MAG: SDR family NAD(P)-dependent oxidoreductase [Deltaproteobacteria bacterium]